ncbi:hypothetical protein ETB97_006227 [Aspergillus alliaceus]|uniref:Zn(2)-C6 fungal-type domain-containing protein n=1 Tax=Petromyces alliaceus TaxID=209559 RepID=A0A8H6E2N0_PETAA|nr:hypothetical protein ETB97_006227 [Aspergillus burnettii]
MSPTRPGASPASFGQVLVSSTVERTKASRACSTCREKKAKCTGGIPCERCRRTGTVCLLDIDSDRRRKVVLKHSLEAVQRYRNLLMAILEILGDDNKTRSLELIEQVKTGASLEEISQYVAKAVGQNDFLGSPTASRQVSVEPKRTQSPKLEDSQDIMDIKNLIHGTDRGQ